MIQYCRYCANALDYEDTLVCEANAPCGNNGSGRGYDIEKAKRINTCKHFEFNPNDLLGQNPDGSFRQYQPRKAYKSKAQQALEVGQMVMEVMGNELDRGTTCKVAEGTRHHAGNRKEESEVWQ